MIFITVALLALIYRMGNPYFVHKYEEEILHDFFEYFEGTVTYQEFQNYRLPCPADPDDVNAQRKFRIHSLKSFTLLLRNNLLAIEFNVDILAQNKEIINRRNQTGSVVAMFQFVKGKDAEADDGHAKAKGFPIR